MYKGGRKLGAKNKKTRARPDGKKISSKCNILKPLSDFHKHKNCIAGYNTVCKLCRLPLSKKNYSNTSLEYRLWTGAKRRARLKNREFSIELSDILIPSECPVFKLPFESIGEFAPSVDRIDSTKGYIKGNIQIISKRANMLKNNATIEELNKIIIFIKGGSCDL